MASRLLRLFWLTVLVGHATLALAWWWVQPGGFRPSHPRFWANRVAPAVVLAISIAALIALRRQKMGALGLLLPSWPAAWAAAGLACRIVFPTTLATLWLLPEAAAALMALAVVPACRLSPKASRTGGLASGCRPCLDRRGPGLHPARPRPRDASDQP